MIHHGDTMKEKHKKMVKEMFAKNFKDCDLFCVQLDGFMHTIYYKDKHLAKHIATYTNVAPEQYMEERMNPDGVYRSHNADEAKSFFEDIGCDSNYFFQHNAQEVIFKDVKEW